MSLTGMKEWLHITFILLTMSQRPVLASVNDPKPINILVLLPFFDNTTGSGWDKGVELLPAARIARDEINQQKDMLPGYRMEFIEASSDACGYALAKKSIINFADKGIGYKGSEKIAGIAGLACSSVTATISSLAGRDDVSFLQLSIANSPAFDDISKYPRLWRFLSSSVVFVNATLALMDAFNWSRVAMVYDELGVYFSYTGNDFVNRVDADSKKTVVVKSTLNAQSTSHVHSVIEQIKTNTARIIFVSATAYETSFLLCHAVEENIIWPGYLWILHTHKLQDYISSSPCERSVLLTAIEKMVLLTFNLEPIGLDVKLISGQTYGQLKDKYLQELYNLSQEEPYKQYEDLITFADQVYAYPVYDEIWTLALALNQSIPELAERNISLSDITYGESDFIDIVENQLETLSFQGAASYIKFSSKHETHTSINIIQIINGEEVMIGVYELEQLVLSSNVTKDFPSDNFEIVYQKLHEIGTYILFSILSIAVAYISLMLFLILLYSRSPDIKADSPLLSLLIFSGCYAECASVAMQVMLLSFNFSSTAYSAICTAALWCNIVGVDIILSTIVVRIARIYRIFTHFGRTGKAWTDQALFIYVILLSIIPNVLMILWVSIDPPKHSFKSIFHLEQNPPYVEYIEGCEYSIIWIMVQIVYSALLIAVLLFLAVQTRKIKTSRFKDTKKINFLIFTLVLQLSFSLIVWQILVSLDFDLYGSIVLICGLLTVTVTCQAFLFSPKVFPVLFEHIRTGTYRTAPKRRKRSMVRSASYTLQNNINSTLHTYM